MREFLSEEALQEAAQVAALNDFDISSSCNNDVCDMTSRVPDVHDLSLQQRLTLLNEIGRALSAVRDEEQLLDLILYKARELTCADAGTLYLVNTSGTKTRDDDTLYFRLPQNDSIVLGAIHAFPVAASSLAGYAALTGKTLCFEDVYNLQPDAPYRFNANFDLDNGYRTKSVLVVPMRDHKGNILGVLQLINRKRRWDTKLLTSQIVESEVLPFDAELVDLAASLASQAAVAIENNLLLKNIRELFESFVVASSSAIEDRDPSTSGHSQRVTALTLEMACAAHFATEGPFKDVRFSPVEMKVLRYAGLLHDFGKIGVPEHILTKSHKLEPEHFEVVKSRLFALRQERKANYASQMATVLREQAGREGGREIADAICGQLEEQMRAEMAEFDTLVQMLQHANDPAITMLPDDDYARQQELLQRLSEMTYENERGERAPLLTEDERVALSIRKGSLTLEEYRRIQTHAQLSYEFLKKIRWTDEFARVPLIAWAHHEKLNGKGYPRGVTGDGIELESRMMTVADIFDALTAADRPYKKAMPVELALQILRYEAREGGLDNDVVELFINEKIYESSERWINRFCDDNPQYRENF